MDPSRKIVRSQSPEADALSGLRKSARADRISVGLLPPPFSLGGRAAGFFAHELESVAAARAGGADDEAVRALVTRLMEARNAQRAA